MIFGAAKPVPINYLALRNPKRDMIWIGLSGPSANFLFAVALRLIWAIVPVLALREVFFYLIFINVLLGVFNLVPIPPLDGSRILMGLLPQDLAVQYARLEPYGFFIIMALFFMGIFQAIVWPIIGLLLSILGV